MRRIFVTLPASGRDDQVAFACKGRVFCPSCCSRRMTDTAAHLVDDVLPRVPVRQWVLSFPHRVRYLLAYEPRLCAAVRRIFERVVLGWLEAQAQREGNAEGLDVIAENKIEETTNSTLAIAGGEVFLRTHEHPYCIEED